VDGEHGQRREAEEDRLADGLALQLARELLAQADALGERDDRRDQGGVEDEERGAGDEGGDELGQAEDAVGRAVGEQLVEQAAGRDRQCVLPGVERPRDEALAVQAVGQGAGHGLHEQGRRDPAEQQEREHEGRRQDELALAPAELHGEDLAGEDGQGQDDDRRLDAGEHRGALRDGDEAEHAEAGGDDGGHVQLPERGARRTCEGHLDLEPENDRGRPYVRSALGW
jgi:hypothetical protein